MKDDQVKRVLNHLRPGPATSRFSVLDRFHLKDYKGQGPADVFLGRDIYGDILGLGIVSRQQKQYLGERGFGYLGTHLVSSPTEPLRVVEGPYDVLDPGYLCVFGLPQLQQLRRLAGHYIILTPDGDVWESRRLKPRMVHLVNALRTSQIAGPVLIGVEVLPPGGDPDTIPVAERRLYRFV